MVKPNPSMSAARTTQLPLGILTVSSLLGLSARWLGSGALSEISFWTMAVGLILGFLFSPEPTTKGTVPPFFYFMSLALFSLAWLLQRSSIAAPGIGTIILSSLGVASAAWATSHPERQGRWQQILPSPSMPGGKTGSRNGN